MKTYPTGELAKSLFEYHVERIHTMERELALVKQENELLHSIIKQQAQANEESPKPVRQD